MAVLLCVTLYAQERNLLIYQNGQITFSAPTGTIDYITIVDGLSAPTNVTASVESNKIVVTWKSVSKANQYEIQRSTDGVNYTTLGTRMSTTFSDSAPANGSNYYRVKAIGSNGESSAYSEPCGPVMFGLAGSESGIYMGMFAFNNELKSYPVQLLTDDTESGFVTFINGLTQDNMGTKLLYAFDQSITALENFTFPDDLFNVSIITFTDGLDQGSLNHVDFLTTQEYLTYLNNRLQTTTINGNKINSYAIGLKSPSINENLFYNSLKQLASSDDNWTVTSDMSTVNNKFMEIANQISSSSYEQSLKVRITTFDHGTKIRFTFDNCTSALTSNCYIEGVFDKTNYSLKNVKYVGLTSSSGSVVYAERGNDGILTFTFDKVVSSTGEKITREFIKEYNLLPSETEWQWIVEFDKDEQTEIIVKKKTAAIIMNLDCSASLAEKFTELKNIAASFVNRLVKEQEDSGPGFTGEWVSIGKGTMEDGWIVPLFSWTGTGNRVQPSEVPFEVEIMKYSTRPGLYKIIDPWGENHPVSEQLEHNNQRDLIIDATSSIIYIDPQETGVSVDSWTNIKVCNREGELNYFGHTESEIIQDEWMQEFATTIRSNVIDVPCPLFIYDGEDSFIYWNFLPHTKIYLPSASGNNAPVKKKHIDKGDVRLSNASTLSSIIR